MSSVSSSGSPDSRSKLITVIEQILDETPGVDADAMIRVPVHRGAGRRHAVSRAVRILVLVFLAEMAEAA